MSITHIIINSNFLYLFKNKEKHFLLIEIYDINKKLELINKKTLSSDYFDYYMNAIYLYKDNFYILGGYCNDKLRSFKFITIINIKFDTINIIKSKNDDIPKKRVFIDNNNIVIKNDILYLAGGYSEYYTEDYNIFDDMWCFDLKSKTWKNIKKNMFLYIENEKIVDYIEIYDGNNNNIIITGKYLNFYYFLYDINKNIIHKINLKDNIKKELYIDNFIIYKVFYKNDNIYIILNNNEKIFCVKINIKNYYVSKNVISNNFNMNDIIINNDENNIYVYDKEKKSIESIKIFRFENNLYDEIINFIRSHDNFTFQDYNILPNKIKTDI